MPGSYHDELRRVWASLDANKGTRDPVELPVDGQALQGKGPTSTASSATHQLPDRAATCCLQMCGVLTEEERALREKGGSIMAQTRGTCPGCHTARTLDHDMNCPKAAWTRTTRHDMIVTCLYLRVSGKFNAELEIKTHSHLSDQNQKPDIWLVDKCKAIDVGVIQPRQMDATARRSRSTGTGRSRSSWDRRIPPPQVQEAPRGAPCGRREALCPGCLRHRPHGCRGERAPDEADQTRPGRKPGHPERPSPVILLLTTE
ncbi:Hypothetical protein DHA2_151502 [Giardia duodenalis]|uniref:Reverse transcriptase/endonuclease n=1 Tax=Giardia intestinalis TaxID=5741 RepID=V6TGG4_GIAIN|nr:Hypothetical protein DHA2_151502 [Giardia intestinalis]